MCRNGIFRDGLTQRDQMWRHENLLWIKSPEAKKGHTLNPAHLPRAPIKRGPRDTSSSQIAQLQERYSSRTVSVPLTRVWGIRKN